jgi:hypothetical protein
VVEDERRREIYVVYVYVKHLKSIII